MAGAVLCLAALRADASAGAAGSFHIATEAGLINLRVDEPVPLNDVLDALAAAFSATVEGDGGSALVEPVRADGLTLQEALALILSRRSFVVEMADGTARVRRIVLMEEKTAGERPEASITRSSMSPARAKKPKSERAAALRDIVKLSYRRDGSSLTALTDIARDQDSETAIRVAAIRALANFADLGAIPFLAERLHGDPQPQIRLAAAEAIVQSKTAQARALIGRAIAWERNDAVRQKLQSIFAPTAERGASKGPHPARERK